MPTRGSHATRRPGAGGVIDAHGNDPLWFKDAVIYQLHVKSFCDSSGDGIGDFPGLVSKLDYLQELGVSALWLLPFYPSPLRDDGYDIADFTAINPSYGVMRDVKTLLREAHARGMRVITELVLNHTSDQHPWFQRAREAGPRSRWGRFYVWSDTPDRYPDARIIFQYFETSNWTWDPVAGAYYWHRFYSHQPDLNYENPEVHRAVTRALDFWFEQGVDGLRLDAVPYLYEQDGTMCENLPATHAFLKTLRAHIDETFENRMLLAEANQWPEDAAEYFGDGDECHMAFHFPVMPRLFMALQMEDRFPIVDILQQTPQIPETSQWAVFLRNHDELTLEMVTDEERDFMYRMYARDSRARINLGIRRRLAPLLGKNRRKIELLNGLLMSLPGTPVIYYGDEIGMGDNVYLGDRDGVRTPMQWSPDRCAGFSSVNPQKLPLPVIIDPEYHYETVNVETQAANPESLLWWMRRVISLRRRHQVFGRGDMQFLSPDNHRVLAFVRSHEGERVLVVANLSRFVQTAQIDLSEWKGLALRELFGQTAFPPAGDLPYLLTLGPHEFYWLAIEEPAEAASDQRPAPSITVRGKAETLFQPRARARLEGALASFLPQARWFAGKDRSVQAVRITDVVPLPGPGHPAAIALSEVSYLEGEPETYVVPLAVLDGEEALRVAGDHPGAVVADAAWDGGSGVIADGMSDRATCAALMDLLRRRRRLAGASGTLASAPTSEMRRVLAGAGGHLEPDLFRAEQSNTSVVFGHRIILKVFRRSAPGLNPDLELGLHLNRSGFHNAPPVLGALTYTSDDGTERTLAIAHEVVENEGDAWTFMRDEIGRFYERILAAADEPPASPGWDDTLPVTALAALPTPDDAGDEIGNAVMADERLGARVAGLHAALAAGTGPAFRPEATVPLYLRSTYQSLRNLERGVLRQLSRAVRGLPEAARPLAQEVLERADEISALFSRMVTLRQSGLRTRYHGDLHLGQVLHTGWDFVLIDFEGEPARSMADRRVKRSPLRDVAGMLRSFDYVRHVGARDAVERGLVEPDSDQHALLERWDDRWTARVSGAFLRSYLAELRDATFLPADPETLQSLLTILLMEKAVYECGYELGSRPDWVDVPLRGVLDLLDSA